MAGRISRSGGAKGPSSEAWLAESPPASPRAEEQMEPPTLLQLPKTAWLPASTVAEDTAAGTAPPPAAR
eukprot:5540226-Lingulodinium_polyedra.AAC.1